MVDTDDGLFVVKFRGAGQGAKALVAELISGMLAMALELPIPDLALVHVSDTFGRSEPDPEISDVLRKSHGINVALRYLDSAFNFDATAAGELIGRSARDCIPRSTCWCYVPCDRDWSAAHRARQCAWPVTDRYGGWLLIALDSIPANQYGFHPTPVQQSIGFIAQHLEDANYELCSTFGAEKRVKSAKDALPDTVKAHWPKDTLIARVRGSLEFCAAAIRGLSDAQLGDKMTVNTAAGPQTVLRARFLILLVTDLAEHYAQLSGYMRILGLVPPSALPPPQR